MMTKPFHAPMLLMLALAATSASAQSTATAPATQPATMAATEPSTEPAVFAATDKAAILKAVGTHAVITGKVSNTNAIPSITFIDFAGNQRGDFAVIIKEAYVDAVNKGFPGGVEAAVKDKKIKVTGVITKYNTTPQIEVTKPDQITILSEKE